MAEFTKENWQEEVINSKIPVIVDFTASWCPPCRAIAPIIDKLAKERTDVKIGKINVDDNAELASSQKISAIPALLFFKGGKELHRHSGLVTEQSLTKMIDEYFSD